MDAEKMTTALYEKMRTEQNKYRSRLEALPPEEILKHAHEDVCCKGGFQPPNTTWLRLISGRWTGSYGKGEILSISWFFHNCGFKNY